ncbi:MAG: hypothetical protein LBE79_07285 [Tannerella sp.]|jgi:sedoheptulokinase|nr:hypothetical protein [Tannerella sp.]
MTSIDYDSINGDLPIVETLFDGTRLEPMKRGNITNISMANLTPDKLIIGFLKGICNELYDFYRLIPEDVKQSKSILVGSGNGVKLNSLLCKAFEEQFKYTLHLSQIREEAAFGACLCAVAGSKHPGGSFDINEISI